MARCKIAVVSYNNQNDITENLILSNIKMGFTYGHDT